MKATRFLVAILMCVGCNESPTEPPGWLHHVKRCPTPAEIRISQRPLRPAERFIYQVKPRYLLAETVDHLTRKHGLTEVEILPLGHLFM
ncbi:MAG TPA: hypothetical protein VFT12_12245, partial [Thermoanaerobaculia bacterium]|nr:hypothetical protein [Thermoanaerobaculia bacterium]